MFKFTLAKCPLGGGEYTASDWWFVLSRHKDYDCAEEALSKITCEQKLTAKYQIFKLRGYAAGSQFNIKTIQERHKRNENVSN